MILFIATKNFLQALQGFLSPQPGDVGDAVTLPMTVGSGTHCIVRVQSTGSPRRACGCSWAAHLEQGSTPWSP